MNSASHSRIVALIWAIADDVLRDLYVRGKYRDVILPFTVLRRLDSVLEPTKNKVVATKKTLDNAGIVNQDAESLVPIVRRSHRSRLTAIRPPSVLVGGVDKTRANPLFDGTQSTMRRSVVPTQFGMRLSSMW